MIIIVKVCRSDAGAPEVRTSFLHEKCEVWRPVWPIDKSLGSWGSHVGPGCCWRLNRNFWVTNVPRSSNSVLPRTLWPPRAGPCGLTHPGPAVRCNLLEGRLLELLHHLPPPLTLLLLHRHTVHCSTERGQPAGPAPLTWSWADSARELSGTAAPVPLS